MVRSYEQPWEFPKFMSISIQHILRHIKVRETFWQSYYWISFKMYKTINHHYFNPGLPREPSNWKYGIANIIQTHTHYQTLLTHVKPWWYSSVRIIFGILSFNPGLLQAIFPISHKFLALQCWEKGGISWSMLTSLLLISQHNNSSAKVDTTTLLVQNYWAYKAFLAGKPSTWFSHSILLRDHLQQILQVFLIFISLVAPWEWTF